MLKKYFNNRQYSMDRNLIITSMFFGFAICGILLLNLETKHYTTGMRGYIAEQGIWAKKQKEAVIELIQYAHTHDENHYKKFNSYLLFINKSKQARQELDKPDPDMNLVHQDLLSGENSEINKEYMADVYRYLSRHNILKSLLGVNSFTQAFDERKLADHHIEQLQKIAAQLHQNIADHNLDEAGENEFVDQIYQLDKKLTGHEKNFTYLIDRAARHINGDLFETLMAIGLILLILFILASIKILVDLKNWKKSIISSLDQFRLLFENSMEGILLTSPDGKINAANDAARKLFGYSEQALNNLQCSDLVSDDEHSLHSFIENRNSKGFISGKLKFQTQSQINFIGQISSSIFKDERGNEQAYLIIRDITKSEKYLQKLEESEQGYRDLLNSIQDGIYIQDKNQRYLQVNEAGADMYGISKEQLIGKKPDEAIPELEHSFKMIDAYFDKALQGQPQIFEWWDKRGDAESYPTEIKLVNGSYKGEKVVIGVARDISDRKKAERKIRRNEQLFRQLFQNAPVGIIYFDRDRKLQNVNNSFESMFGYSADDLNNADLEEILVPDHLKNEARDIRRLAFAGQPEQLETVRKKKDGSLLSVKMALIPVISRQEIIGIYVLYMDITDRKLAEERKVLLSEIHHRVKNNMAIISGMLQLQAFETDDPKIKEMLYDSQLRIQSMASIHELLYQSNQFTNINFRDYLNKLLLNIKGTVDMELYNNIELKLNVDDVFLNINQAIPSALVLNELITNSYKHAFRKGEKGRIEIRVTENEGEIEMVVQDNGVGLPDDFETSHSDSLGMTLVNTLVSQLEADFSIQNGHGSRFKIDFQKDEHLKGSASAVLN